MIMKRLIKKSYFYEGFKIEDKNFEIYKNPITSKDVNLILSQSDFSAIRGVILDDGTVYIWSGEVIHNKINRYFTAGTIDINQFRFAYEIGDGWIIDCHDKYTYNEIVNLIVKYENILTVIGDLNESIDIYFYVDNDNDGIGTTTTMNKIKEYQKTIKQNDDFDIDNVLNDISNSNIQSANYRNQRLVKKSELYNAFDFSTRFYDYYFEVYKSPLTSKEISTTSNADPSEAIRGVILDDGTIYIWPGNTLHMHINKYLKDIQINIDQFRFAYEKEFGWWLIDAHKSYTWDNITDLTIKYENILSQIGDINAAFNIFSYIDDNNNYPEELTLDEIKQYKIENNSNKQQEYIVK